MKFSTIFLSALTGIILGTLIGISSALAADNGPEMINPSYPVVIADQSGVLIPVSYHSARFHN